MASLYFIENVGCDDVTCGLAVIPEDAFLLFKSIIKNLNKNSQYPCMPTINAYKIDKSFVRPATNKDMPYQILYDETGAQYVLDKPIWVWDAFRNRVLNEGAEIVC